ncbi:MAG: hypothetical protein HY718_16300 [Planctomycetes bacterium]|nr:hypothetical protein [Planctomycetota bacterium]
MHARRRAATFLALSLSIAVPGSAAELNWSPQVDPAGNFPRLAWSTAVIQDCDDPSEWSLILPAGASAALGTCDGVDGNGIRIDYDLGTGNWVIAYHHFAQPLDLCQDDFIGLWYCGSPATSEHRLEVKVKDGDDEFILHVPRVAHVPACVHAYLDHRLFNDQDPGVGDGVLDWSDIREILIAVARGNDLDYSHLPPNTAGTLCIDLVASANSKPRTVPLGFERLTGNSAVAADAAEWIAGRQDPNTHLIPSWEGDAGPWAYLYDQALALLVLMHEHPDEAADLAEAIAALQLPDGSWHRRYDTTTGLPVSMNDPAAEFWVGDTSWMVYALARYAGHVQSLEYARSALRGAAYLKTQLYDDCGGRAVHWVTEGNIDAWWAFQATAFYAEADAVLAYLDTCVWDVDQQRWLGGRTSGSWNSLDSQAWGGPLHVATGRPVRCLAALGFAAEALRTWDFRHIVEAMDGQGPFSVWYEGVAQYVCARGPGAQSLLDNVLNPARKPGGCMPGTPPLPPGLPNQETWSGDGIWLPTWCGVAPTAWLYFANTNTPFAVGPFVSCRADLDYDADVDAADLAILSGCASGPAMPQPDPDCRSARLDDDDDVDQVDFAVFQRCWSGPDRLADPNCAE